MRRPTLDEPHKLRDPELRINFAEQMNVLRHDFQLDDLGLGFRRNFVNNLFKPSGDRLVQHFSPVLRTENNVVRARVHDISVRLILRLRRHMNSIPRLAVYY